MGKMPGEVNNCMLSIVTLGNYKRLSTGKSGSVLLPAREHANVSL